MSLAFRLRPFLLAVLVSSCGGSNHATSNAAMGDASDEGLAGGSTTDGSRICPPALGGSCACTKSGLPPCYGSTTACAEATGGPPEYPQFVVNVGAIACETRGVWTNGAPCPHAGIVGGCRQQIGYAQGCPVMLTTWYYDDIDGGVHKADDVKTLCANAYMDDPHSARTFVPPP